MDEMRVSLLHFCGCSRQSHCLTAGQALESSNLTAASSLHRDDAHEKSLGTQQFEHDRPTALTSQIETQQKESCTVSVMQSGGCEPSELVACKISASEVEAQFALAEHDPDVLISSDQLQSPGRRGAAAAGLQTCMCCGTVGWRRVGEAQSSALPSEFGSHTPTSVDRSSPSFNNCSYS